MLVSAVALGDFSVFDFYKLKYVSQDLKEYHNISNKHDVGESQSTVCSRSTDVEFMQISRNGPLVPEAHL